MTQTNPLVKPFMNLIFDILPNVITRPSGSAPIKVRANIKRVNLNPSKSCSVTSRNIILFFLIHIQINVFTYSSILHNSLLFVKNKNCLVRDSFYFFIYPRAACPYKIFALVFFSSVWKYRRKLKEMLYMRQMLKGVMYYKPSWEYSD